MDSEIFLAKFNIIHESESEDNLSNLFLVNLLNGDLIKSKENKAGFNSNIKVSKQKFLIIDFENTIRCFSTIDGKELWNFQTEIWHGKKLFF